MTDQTIPADLHPDDVALARDFADEYRDSEYAPDRTLAVARVLQALLPPPSCPTLADMPREERAECRWMQADVKGRSARYVIATPSDRNGLAGLVSADGGIEWTYPERITPRPDLPRMEWPGDKQPAPALPEGWRFADHPHYGRVIVTRTEPDLDGEVAITVPVPTNADRARLEWCRPDELTYIDTDQDADQ